MKKLWAWLRSLGLIDDWRAELRRLWSVRVALFWGAACGLLMCWPALADTIPVRIYVIGGMVIAASIAGARMLKQPGTES
jgi:hypothetical protein